MAEENQQTSKANAAGKPRRKASSSKRQPDSKPNCGVIMPISLIDGCNVEHWSDVREILEEAIDEAGFVPRLVSDADEVGIIQQRIIQNVYDDPIVVCDVSCKNPNVMFELGMRLAFDKPTIIVKDDKTSYSFDTAPIEHLEYPRDLRFAKIVDFKESLASKIEATYKKSQTDKNYTTFLKNFGSFSVAKLETRSIDKNDYILDELRALKSLVLRPSLVQPESSGTLFGDETVRFQNPRDFIRIAVRSALQRLGPTTVHNNMEMRKFVDYIVNRSPRIDRHFESRAALEKAIERELRQQTKLG